MSEVEHVARGSLPMLELHRVVDPRSFAVGDGHAWDLLTD
jgi:hypothetical protein